MFAIVPLFGFASAGVALGGGISEIAKPLSLAILAGLFLGKQLGIFGAIWVVVRSGLVSRPAASWRQLYGASILCGIGFTMSLFISALAFPGNEALVDQAKLGTLAGSLLSALAGYAILRLSPPAAEDEHDTEDAAELFAAHPS